MGRSIYDRFVEKMGAPDPVTGCREWLGNLTGGKPDGSSKYGYFGMNGKDRPAHRVSFEIHKGEIPAGCHIDHLCRNPRCVAPRHLEAVMPGMNSFRGVGAE
jgi:hypothetical protein